MQDESTIFNAGSYSKDLLIKVISTFRFIEKKGSTQTICTQDAALNYAYASEGIDPCDRSCNNDEDCKFECGCDCISKEENCIYTGVECEQLDPNYGCKCINNTCDLRMN